MVDVEKTVIAFLLASVDGLLPGQVATRTPPDLSERLPFLQVLQVGGSRLKNQLQPRVNITSWGSSREDAHDLAAVVDDCFQYNLPTLVGGAVLALLGTTQSPTWQPYTNLDFHRFIGTYRLGVHPDPGAAVAA